jgi:hypothetical protein
VRPPSQSTLPWPGPVCWKQIAPKLGTGTGGTMMEGTLTPPSPSVFRPRMAMLISPPPLTRSPMGALM